MYKVLVATNTLHVRSTKIDDCYCDGTPPKYSIDQHIIKNQLRYEHKQPLHVNTINDSIAIPDTYTYALITALFAHHIVKD